MKWLFYICLIILIPSIGLFCKSYLSLHQELNIHASEIETDSPLVFSAKTKYVYNSNNQRIAYLSFPARNPQAIVILVHGYSNPGGKNQMLAHVNYLNDAGYSVYLPDLRSFGESEGHKISLGVEEWQDLETLYDFIFSDPENDHLKIGYLGFSMGASTAINSIAKTGKGDFIIAVSPYSSVDSLYQFRLKQEKSPTFLFTKLAIRAELGSASQSISPQNLISKINVPLLIFAAQNDTHVDSYDAKKLYDLADTTKDYWQADSDHDIYAAYPQDFQEQVLTFLDKID